MTSQHNQKIKKLLIYIDLYTTWHTLQESTCIVSIIECTPSEQACWFGVGKTDLSVIVGFSRRRVGSSKRRGKWQKVICLWCGNAKMFLRPFLVVSLQHPFISSPTSCMEWSWTLSFPHLLRHKECRRYPSPFGATYCLLFWIYQKCVCDR